METSNLSKIVPVPSRSPEKGIEGWVIFTISAPDLDPDHITMEIDIQPDRTYTMGNEKIWQIHSTHSATESLEEHFTQLLMRLLPIRKKLRSIARRAKLEFYCFLVKKPKSTAFFEISPKHALFTGYIGAHLAIDVAEKGDEFQG